MVRPVASMAYPGQKVAVKLLDLPIPQSGCGDTRLISDCVSLSIEFEYKSGDADMVGTIHFAHVKAYRFSPESSLGVFRSEAYESVAEVLDSGWSKEIGGEVPAARPSRHFNVFLSSNGTFEVLAASVRLAEPRLGLLR